MLTCLICCLLLFTRIRNRLRRTSELADEKKLSEVIQQLPSYPFVFYLSIGVFPADFFCGTIAVFLPEERVQTPFKVTLPPGETSSSRVWISNSENILDV